ncbi:MAG: hypothetical protein AAGH65_02760, partial [Pseudomonadota bacterium]
MTTAPYRIYLKNLELEFQAAAGQTLLEAARSAGLALDSPANGPGRGPSRYRLIDGQVLYAADAPVQLPTEQLADGRLNIHQAVAVSDLVIEANTAEPAAAAITTTSITTSSATVIDVAELTPAVRRIRLKLEQWIEFEAGQYVNVIFPDGKPRPFSIASAPSNTDYIELQIK